MKAPALLLAAFFLTGPGAAAAATPARDQELIALLHLQPLAGESGYFAVIGRSTLQVTDRGRPLAAQSQIYYLLNRAAPTNFLHWLEPADTHVLLEGGPVDYYLFHPDGSAEHRVLGRDVAAGEAMVIAVPAGCGKALRLRPGAAYALMANVLAPEWTPDRVRIGAPPDFLRRYTGAAPWATADFLRGLAGPDAGPARRQIVGAISTALR